MPFFATQLDEYTRGLDILRTASIAIIKSCILHHGKH